MALYFFHILGRGLVQDIEGVELSDINEVREEALQGARDILADSVANGLDRTDLYFNVVDDGGKTVLTFEFKDAIEPRRSA